MYVCISKITFEVLKKNIDERFKNIDVITTRCIIIGDFNIKSVLPNVNDYNEKLIEHMLKKHNMKQYVNTSTTENGSILDLCFSNCSNIEHVVTRNHWLDHKIISVILQMKSKAVIIICDKFCRKMAQKNEDKTIITVSSVHFYLSILQMKYYIY